MTRHRRIAREIAQDRKRHRELVERINAPQGDPQTEAYWRAVWAVEMGAGK